MNPFGMPPIAMFPPYYLGVVAFGLLAGILGWRVSRERHTGRPLKQLRASVALLVLLVALTGLFSVLTFGEYVTANTWVYHYYADFQTGGGSNESVILPVPVDVSLLDGLRVAGGTANWSRIASVHGPGLYVALSGAAVLDASVRLYAPGGNHPDASLTATVNGSASYVWIWYSGEAPANLSFQYGDGYVFNGASVYTGPLVPGWNAYRMWPAPLPP